MVTFARVKTDFQARPEVQGSLPDGLVATLSTQAFPACSPPSLEDARDYQGFKLLGYQGQYLCFSRFSYAGAVDDYGRAIASARILVLPVEELRRHRDLNGLLGQVDGEGSELALEAAQRPPLVDRQTTFAALAPGSGMALAALPELLARLCTQPQLIIAGMDGEARQRLFALLFFLLPLEVLAQGHWSSYAAFHSERAEPVVALARTVTPHKRGLFDRIPFLRGKQATTAEVDAKTGILGFHLELNRREKRLARLFDELIHGRHCPELTFPEAYGLIQDLLSRETSGRPLGIAEKALPASLQKILAQHR